MLTAILRSVPAGDYGVPTSKHALDSTPSGRALRYPTSREKRARCGAPMVGCQVGIPGSGLLHEVGGHGIFVERVVARHHRQAALGHEVVAPVFFPVVADHGAFRQMHVAIDDGAPDAAVTANVDMGEDDARFDLGIGVHPYVLRKDTVADHGARDDAASRDH